MVHARDLVVSAAAAGLVAVAILSSTPTAASVSPVNPVSGGRGFLVLVEDNAVLTSAGMDGPLAVGGDIAIGGAFNVAVQAAGTFAAPGDDAASALVVGGKIDFKLSAPGAILGVRHGHAKVGDLTGAFVRNVDAGGASANTRILPADSYETMPRVELAVPQAPTWVGPAQPLPFDRIFADFRNRSRQLATCPNTVILRDSRGAPIASPIPPAANVRVVLAPGRTNVLAIKSMELNNIAKLTFVNRPTASSPLLINVDTSDVEGDFAWTSPYFAGIGGEQARFILINFPGALHLNHASGDSIEGTVFAPQAEFVDDNPANVEGNIIARELRMSSGEVRDAPLSAKVSCLPPPSPSTSPSTSPSASPTAGPTGPVGASPAESYPRPTGPTDSPWDFVSGSRVQITGVPLTLIAIGGSLLVVLGLVLLRAALTRE